MTITTATGTKPAKSTTVETPSVSAPVESYAVELFAAWDDKSRIFTRGQIIRDAQDAGHSLQAIADALGSLIAISVLGDRKGRAAGALYAPSKSGMGHYAKAWSILKDSKVGANESTYGIAFTMASGNADAEGIAYVIKSTSEALAKSRPTKFVDFASEAMAATKKRKADKRADKVSADAGTSTETETETGPAEVDAAPTGLAAALAIVASLRGGIYSPADALKLATALRDAADALESGATVDAVA